MRNEAIRPAAHQRRAGQDDDPRRPAIAEARQHPDAQRLEAEEEDGERHV